MSHLLDDPLHELSAYELVQNVEHGCHRVPASVTWGELGWPEDYHVVRCGGCRSCRALQRLEQGIEAITRRTKR